MEVHKPKMAYNEHTAVAFTFKVIWHQNPENFKNHPLEASVAFLKAI